MISSKSLPHPWMNIHLLPIWKEKKKTFKLGCKHFQSHIVQWTSWHENSSCSYRVLPSSCVVPRSAESRGSLIPPKRHVLCHRWFIGSVFLLTRCFFLFPLRFLANLTEILSSLKAIDGTLLAVPFLVSFFWILQHMSVFYLDVHVIMLAILLAL